MLYIYFFFNTSAGTNQSPRRDIYVTKRASACETKSNSYLLVRYILYTDVHDSGVNARVDSPVARRNTIGGNLLPNCHLLSDFLFPV